MSEKPKRKFWQFHLSTAIATSATLGLLLLLFTIPRAEHEIRTWGLSTTWDDSLRVRGWPLQFEIDGGGPFDDLRETIWTRQNFAINLRYALLIDIAVALGCSIFTGVLVESILRRREDRKP